MEQARRADRELAEGRYRGPLHGIPWGAKDLLAVRGYPTTWGATPYKEQRFDEDATVVRRLDAAGAVLVAKLTMGALANGDVWFGGTTRNPWNPEEGSRGSSAGSSAAVAAGLVGFAIGTETRGSILSPCTRCGATGLRPTFGLVSRHGAMALSWSMDKIGPICRAVEDCALVFDAIHGPDGRDETVIDMPFSWDVDRDPSDLRVGYLRSAFEAEPDENQREWHEFNLATLEAVRSMGIELVPLELPEVPISALGFILRVEAAAAFDEMTRTNLDDTLVRQDPSAWPNRLRARSRRPGGRIHPGQPRAPHRNARDGPDSRGDRRLPLTDPGRQPPHYQPHGPPGGGRAQRLPGQRHTDQRHLLRQSVPRFGGLAAGQGLPGGNGFPPSPSSAVDRVTMCTS